MKGMTNNCGSKGSRRSSISLVRLATICLVSTWLATVSPACVEETPDLDPNLLAGFDVTLVDTSALGDEPPYDFASEYVGITIGVEALRMDGDLKNDYNGTLLVSVVPGAVDPATSLITLSNGVNDSHQVRIRFAFGNARIWVEEVGLDQADECRNGFDDDGNGLIDYPADHGCYGIEDPSEGPATYITGVSDELVFKPIGIRTVQYNPDEPAGGSPLEGEEVRLEAGTIIVNNVTSDGFYATDVDETSGYHSIFVYNYDYPEGLLVGDKLAWFSGGVSEFQGCTQLTFPTWEVDETYQLTIEDRTHLSRCEPIDNPDVIEIQPVLLSARDLNDWEGLEALEGAVVRVEDVHTSTTFMDCDFDRSGRIEGTSEELCRGVCQDMDLCTEMSSFRKYDQFTCETGGASFYITKASTTTDFDILERCEQVSDDPLTLSCPPRELASITGSVRHVYLTSRIQLWEVTPRFTCDFLLRCETTEDCQGDQVCEDYICRQASTL